MSKEHKKLAKMYEEYLRENLANSSREEVIEQFVTTVTSAMDFSNPEVYAQVVRILLRYEERKKGREEKKALPQQGDAEEAQESESGDELDFNEMYKPNDFDDLLRYLPDLKTARPEVVEITDLLNLISFIKSVRNYMFDVEVPWVGVIKEVMCIAWSPNSEKNLIVAFMGGDIQMEVIHKDMSLDLEISEDGELEPKGCMKVVYEAHNTLY